MRHRSARPAAVAAIAAIALVSSACGDDSSTAITTAAASQAEHSHDASETATTFPMTIENCGRSLEIKAPPKRVVGLDQISTEILLELGLGDKIVGTANQSDPPFDAVATQYKALKVLSANYPTAEEFVAAESDFVIGNIEFLSYSQEAGFGGAFTRDELTGQGVTSFALICNGETDTQDLLFERFAQLGMIFGVSDKADAVLDDVKASLAATAKVLQGAPAVPTLIYIDGSGPIQTLASDLSRAGGKNIIGPDEGNCCPPEIAVEVIADRAPEAILLSSFGNLDPSGPSVEEKKSKLAATLPTVPAVTKSRYLSIDFIAFSTPARLARDAITIGKFLHPDLTFPS
ncbi:MAG: ABC transporter substrate-binding protein [Acidimicrobiia bacterium]